MRVRGGVMRRAANAKGEVHASFDDDDSVDLGSPQIIHGVAAQGNPYSGAPHGVSQYNLAGRLTPSSAWHESISRPVRVDIQCRKVRPSTSVMNRSSNVALVCSFVVLFCLF